ncbi:MAG: hypothetical protein ACRDZ8_17260, partial [Acidimicrobiales bacterium]
MTGPVEHQFDVTLVKTVVTPGHPSRVVLRVHNLTPAVCTYTLRVGGVEPGWVEIPVVVGPAAPGQTIEAAFAVTLPLGFPVAELAASIQVSPYDGVTGAAVGDPQVLDVVLHVADTGALSATLEPTDIRGGDRGRLEVVIHNRGREPVQVELSSTPVDNQLNIHFSDTLVAVGPGAEVRVRAIVRGYRPRYGSPTRRPFVVRVEGRGAPLALDGVFTQRPMVSGRTLALLVAVCLLAAWIALAVFLLGRVSSKTKQHATASDSAGP